MSFTFSSTAQKLPPGTVGGELKERAKLNETPETTQKKPRLLTMKNTFLNKNVPKIP